MASCKRLSLLMLMLLTFVLTGCGQVAARLPLVGNLHARSQARTSQRQQAQYVSDGNTAYVEGDLDSAEVHYQDALDLNANLAVALHNQGNIDYRNALWEDAIAHYEDALEHHQPQPDTNPWAVSHYNLGNVSYQMSQLHINMILDTTVSANVAEPGSGTVDLAALDNAIEYYKDALRADPTDEDARYNLELALRQRPDQPPPPDEQPQDGEDQQDQQDQEQQDNETPPQDGESQDDESQESPPQDGDSQDGDDSQDGNEQPSESDDGDDSEEDQEDDAGEQESDAEPQEEDTEPQDAEPRDAEDSSDSPPDNEGEPQDAEAGAQPLMMTPAQAAQLLEAAVGQSETLQAYLQQATSPLPPPEQDW
ncbi:MAG: tetratricopeptide repeat protein [Deinococcota bacterium]